MARKRKPKVKAIVNLWDMDEETIQKVITHLEKDFPLSGMLIRYKAEIGRRNDGLSVEDFYKVKEDDENL
ncbi:hypothetical protein PQC34_gp077 [Cronobacter phage A24]|uniref:Uncharacterized protein n=1 Tax=Cronobacter phage A24 TaxID=2795745 RepID=A0A7T5QXN0_9CAUD|nr:hypothetical protein PQC34_gp077 [Cronobacter phage A24]QQG33657.1 hypothetical protein [Cronobacter phage A24]